MPAKTTNDALRMTAVKTTLCSLATASVLAAAACSDSGQGGVPASGGSHPGGGAAGSAVAGMGGSSGNSGTTTGGTTNGGTGGSGETGGTGAIGGSGPSGGTGNVGGSGTGAGGGGGAGGDSGAGGGGGAGGDTGGGGSGGNGGAGGATTAGMGGSASGTGGAGGAVLPTCTPPRTQAPGNSTVTIQFGGTSRRYLLHIPPAYDGTKRLPLVFDVHGYTSFASEQRTRSKWDQMADREGFVLINPDGVDESWNAGSCCGGNRQDDVGFFREMVRKSTSELCIDSKRVYVSGHSNGGAMTYRLACEAADIFAAVAPVCGWMTINPCNPVRPVPVLAIRSTGDSTVTIDTADADISEWLSNNQCPNTPVVTSGVCRTHTGCAGGTEVMDCRPRGNHNFFYATNPDNYLVPDNAWPFFERFSLP